MGDFLAEATNVLQQTIKSEELEGMNIIDNMIILLKAPIAVTYYSLKMLYLYFDTLFFIL